MGFLNDVSNFANALTGGSTTNNSEAFQQNGFIVPPIPSADGGGLPESKIPSQQLAVARRNIIRWFVPETGVINMYVNPQSIDYKFQKLMQKHLTKGGFVTQYWGEELPVLTITGNTASSGIEGLNILYEIYRAEQYNFDAIGLTLASQNSISGLNSLTDSLMGNLGGLGTSIANVSNGLFGLDPTGQNILPQNIPSLGAMATGIEMYYNGWIFRGYFTSFSFTESVARLGLFDYNMTFIVTQRRGYRTNSLPWQRSPNYGPSGDNVPLSFKALK